MPTKGETKPERGSKWRGHCGCEVVVNGDDYPHAQGRYINADNSDFPCPYSTIGTCHIAIVPKAGIWTLVSPPPVGTGRGAWAVGQRRRGQILGVAKPCCKSDETAFEVLGPDQRDWYVRCEACGEQWSFSEDWPNVLVDYGTARAGAVPGDEQPKDCRCWHNGMMPGEHYDSCKYASPPPPKAPGACTTGRCGGCDDCLRQTFGAPQTARTILQAREATRAAKRAEDARVVAGFVDFFDLLPDAAPTRTPGAQ